jgi:hypothetical protein
VWQRQFQKAPREAPHSDLSTAKLTLEEWSSLLQITVSLGTQRDAGGAHERGVLGKIIVHDRQVGHAGRLGHQAARQEREHSDRLHVVVRCVARIYRWRGKPCVYAYTLLLGV